MAPALPGVVAGARVRAAGLGATYARPTAVGLGVRSVTTTVESFDIRSYSLQDPASRRAAVLETVREHVMARSDAFYVVDLNEIVRKYREWSAELPRVRPFYAVKCNDDPMIVDTLAKLGAGFDCASKGEMSMALKLGVSPKDIIFAHPAKQATHLHYASAKGVTRMTFDNVDELRKVAREYPNAELVLRILTDDSHSVCRLGLKFGCPLTEVKDVLAEAQRLGVKVVGISYHVGSGNGNAGSFADAVRDARTAFDIAASLGMKLKLLDIGGGFPGSEIGATAGSDHLRGAPVDAHNPYSKHPSFKTIASAVRGALDTYFPEGCGVDIIAEPGRYFVKSSHALAVNVVGKRVTQDEATGGKRINYYVNDGLYGSFNCVMYDHVTCAPSLVLREHAAVAAPALAVADDAIARLDADGRPVVTDAMGVEHAQHLAESLVPAEPDLEEAEQLVTKRMFVGGDDAGDAPTLSASGAAAAAAAVAAFARTTAAAGATGVAASGGARRGFAYTAADSAPTDVQAFPTSIWGPTCDSIDKISDTLVMPEIAVGDWLVFENMGAYTIAGSCRFNGFPLATKVYLHPDGRVHAQTEEVTA